MLEFDWFESLHVAFSAWFSACLCRFMHPLQEMRSWHSKSQAEIEWDLNGFKRVTLRTVDRCDVCWYAGGYTSSCFHCKATGWRDSGPWNSWSGASSGEDVDEIGYDMIRKHGWKTCVGLTHENVWANMCSDVPQEQKELVPDLLGQQEARPSWWMWVC